MLSQTLGIDTGVAAQVLATLSARLGYLFLGSHHVFFGSPALPQYFSRTISPDIRQVRHVALHLFSCQFNIDANAKKNMSSCQAIQDEYVRAVT